MKVDRFLSRVRKPSRYLGNEVNSVKKNWDEARVRMALVFPDLYEIGMSHLGLQILYHAVNARDGFLAERAYVPDTDMEEELRAAGIALFSLESKRPLAEFDMLGITLPYELCYTNILTILDLAGIPLKSAQRTEDHPLIIGGGPCAFHPEPVAPFFDAILLGDGEEAIVEIAACIADAKKQHLARKMLLEKLADIEGVYIPAFFEPQYATDGNFMGMETRSSRPVSVRRRVLPDLNKSSVNAPPLIPNNRIVHDRLGIELARGCTRGCRFCQAGIIYRPVRERAPEEILRLADQGIAQGGFEELALLSLSTGEYSCLPQVLKALMDRFEEKRVSISMPSMRVGTLTPDVMEQIRRVRKTGFTVAPEAGTERLRRVINKGITEEDLVETCQAAFGMGWRLIKFYFMVGLPTETIDDVAAIADLAGRALAIAGRGSRGQINVSVSTFVPKPHTPFEREPQLNITEAAEKLDFLRARLRDRKLKLKWHDPAQSYLEGVFCRGDRRLAEIIEAAWKKGARLDAWTDSFNLKIWQEAAKEAGIDMDSYLRRRSRDEILPWQHLDAGIDPAWLDEEYQKAMQEASTPDCRVHGCQQCGLCDFKTVMPVLYKSTTIAEPQRENSAAMPEAAPPLPHFKYRFLYSRIKLARFLSHLEILQIFFRAFRRIELPLHYSQGHNPTPKVSFSPALPLGTESLVESLVVDLFRELPAANDMLIDQINKELPLGIEIKSIEPQKTGDGISTIDSYEIQLEGPLSSSRLDAFAQSEQFSVSVIRKQKKRVIDLKEVVKSVDLTDSGTVRISMLSEPGRAVPKPAEVVKAVFGLDENTLAGARIIKTASVTNAEAL